MPCQRCGDKFYEFCTGGNAVGIVPCRQCGEQTDEFWWDTIDGERVVFRTPSEQRPCSIHVALGNIRTGRWKPFDPKVEGMCRALREIRRVTYPGDSPEGLSSTTQVLLYAVASQGLGIQE
jgi:hypothetical protein